MTRQEAIEDLITLFCGRSPPITVERLSQLSESEFEKLQTFLVNEAELPWLTGIGMLEAIDTLVDEAVGNSELAFAQAQKVFAPGDA